MDLYDLLALKQRKDIVESLFDHTLVHGEENVMPTHQYVGAVNIPLLNIELVEKLIDNGKLDVNSRYDDRRNLLDSYQKKCTLLSYAVMWGNVPLIELLVRKNADVNLGSLLGNGNNPLVFAVLLDEYTENWSLDLREQIVRALHAAGNLNFDVHSNRCSHVLLHIAWNFGCEMLDVVLSLGADINTNIASYQEYTSFGDKHLSFGVTDYNLFMYMIFMDDDDMAEELVERGADTEKTAKFFIQDECEALTMLHFAVKYSDAENASRLLYFGVDVNAQDECGFTCLWLAAHENMYGKISLLIKHGANENIRCKPEYGSSTPLEAAGGHVIRQCIFEAIRDRRLLHMLALARQNTKLPDDIMKKILQENEL